MSSLKTSPYSLNFLLLNKLKYVLFFLVIGVLVSCKTSTGNDDDDSNVDLNGYDETTFFKTDGPDILNRQGVPVIIKGFGLGGWLLPEGYMFGIFSHGNTSASDMRRNITDLIGATDAEAWFQLFRDNYVQEKDIIQMKEWGADHVRIPFHYNLFYDIDSESFVEEGFDRIDELLIWCKRNRMDVILDMHAAPGAQSSGDISDSDGTARLWTENDFYGPITIKVWEELARRYKDETIIIGYDLINEPVTPDGYGAVDLARMYSQLITAIRKIDTDHILFIEGNYFATTFDLLTPPMDDNMVYAFHKYWNPTDQGTIQYLVNIRSQYNTPLWLGETGENSNQWFNGTVQLMAANDIGWNWWTHKKYDTITSPLSIPTNDNYQKVIEYWNGGGSRPTAAEAKDGLFKMAEDLHIDNTILREGVVDALFSPTYTSDRRPFKEHTIPGKIDAAHYDYGALGVTFNDVDYERIGGDDVQVAGNKGYGLRNDGVDIQKNAETVSEYNVGWTDDGEWMEYTVNITAGNYDITARVSSGISGSRFRILLDGDEIGERTTVPNTSSYESYQQVVVGNVDLPAGEHTLRLHVLTGGFNISLITIQ